MTDEQEMEDVKKMFGQHKDCVFGGNLPGSQEDYIGPREKEENSLSIVFIGRVHPIKNLYYLLECVEMQKVK